jgi:2-alkenal reductase
LLASDRMRTNVDDRSPFPGKSRRGAPIFRGRVAGLRPASVVLVSLASGLLGALAALGIGSAAGWVGDADTVIAGSPAPRAEPSTTAPSPAAPLVGDDFDPAEIYAARIAGVVTIYALFGDEESGTADASQGSGFVVDDEGHVLTNSHVVTTAGEGRPIVRPASAVFVQFADGDRVRGRIVGHDPFTDVAVVKVDPEAHVVRPVPLGDSDDVVVGEPVAAIGSPFGNESSLTVGVVSATERSIASLTSIYNVVDAIQIDAPINRGNSGGPLFDARGRVVGINAQIRSSTGQNEGVGFAIPINTARRSLDQLVDTGTVRYAYVGVRTTDLTPSLARRFGFDIARGAAITEVTPNSPAERAGLRGGEREEEFNGVTFPVGGDVIVAIAGAPVRSADDVVRLVSDEFVPGETVIFTVVRDGARRRVAVRLGERPR